MKVETKSLPSNPTQRCIWLLFEKPESSIAARVVAVLSVACILLSVIAFCLETVPDLKQRWETIEVDAYNVTSVIPDSLTSSNDVNNSVRIVRNVLNDVTNQTMTSSSVAGNNTAPSGIIALMTAMKNCTSKNCRITTTKMKVRRHFTTNPFWVIETICVTWFTIEVSFLVLINYAG